MYPARNARNGIAWIGATLAVTLLSESGLVSHDVLAYMSGGGLVTLLAIYIAVR